MTIHVITGPPCSGKSTFVMNNAGPADIILDFDLIAQALGSRVTHRHSDAHRRVALAAWTSAMNAAFTWSRMVPNVWIVDTEPSAQRLAQYRVMDARVQAMATPQEEIDVRMAERAKSPDW